MNGAAALVLLSAAAATTSLLLLVAIRVRRRCRLAADPLLLPAVNKFMVAEGAARLRPTQAAGTVAGMSVLAGGAARLRPTQAVGQRRRAPVRMGMFDGLNKAAADFLGGDRQVSLGEFSDGNKNTRPEISQASLNDRRRAIDEEQRAAKTFDGKALEQALLARWGEAYDVDFTKTGYLGKQSLYLNVLPYTADNQPWRHKSRSAYLSHLQAVSERIVKWGRVSSVLEQIEETREKPRVGIPIKTVPIRLDLPDSVMANFKVANTTVAQPTVTSKDGMAFFVRQMRGPAESSNEPS